MLKQEIESKYSKLGDLASKGQMAVTGAGMGPQPTGNVTSLIQSMGTAQAQEALAKGASEGKMYGDISSSVILAALMGSGGSGTTTTSNKARTYSSGSYGGF